MTRITALLAAVAVSALVLAATATTGTTAAPTKLTGTVGPGFTITLKRNGRKVTRLPAGRYRITVSDRSSAHNFRLRGPGVNRQITRVSATGPRRVVLTLRRGRYTYVCDPHASTMRGSFRVT
jgi:plastocyanin